MGHWLGCDSPRFPLYILIVYVGTAGDSTSRVHIQLPVYGAVLGILGGNVCA